MEYAELVQALQDGDDVRVNEILRELIPRLIRFLQIHMRATKSDAEDCVQLSLELAIAVIREDKLKDSNKVLTYLMTTCRNNYLKLREKKREHNYEHLSGIHFIEPSQLKALMDIEREKILEECLDELSNDHRRFITYWLEHPDSAAEDVAKQFDITVSNAWTRKHRIIKQLNSCYKKKSNL